MHLSVPVVRFRVVIVTQNNPRQNNQLTGARRTQECGRLTHSLLVPFCLIKPSTAVNQRLVLFSQIKPTTAVNQRLVLAASCQSIAVSWASHDSGGNSFTFLQMESFFLINYMSSIPEGRWHKEVIQFLLQNKNCLKIAKKGIASKAGVNYKQRGLRSKS